jgi:hypothetical protein
MYDLTFGQNGHFSQKCNQKNHVSFMPMPLFKVNIVFINVDILVKLNLLKNHDFLKWVVIK